jgi:uncharacterized protein YjbI with pentapeptide repeats
LVKCLFTTKYYDLQKQKEIAFQCEEYALASGLCIFHDERYQKRHREEFDTKLNQKIEKSISQGSPLCCIGYHFPELRIENRQFTLPVYFTKSKFHGKAAFSNIFFEGADFSECTFEDVTFILGKFLDAYFVLTKFYGKSSFNTITFENLAWFGDAEFKDIDFINVHFKKKAGFGSAKFRKGYFAKTNFFGKADFNSVDFYDITFSKETAIHLIGDFSESIFHGKTIFRRVTFGGWTKFHNVFFEEQENTVFDVEKLSMVSFVNTDITRVRFTEKVRWSDSQEGKIVDERHLEQAIFSLFDWENVPGNKKQEYKLKDFLKNNFGLSWIDKGTFNKNMENDTISITADENNTITLRLMRNDNYVIVKANDILLIGFVAKKKKNTLKIHLTAEIRTGSIQSIYRNLRENYEYRMRYDEAGKFFVREMELKRKFRETPSVSSLKLKFKSIIRLKWDNSTLPDVTYELKKNNWFRRQFSLTGWYYHLSRYGEAVLWPTLSGIVIVSLSTLYWSMQVNPLIDPSFIGTKQLQNQTHIWKAFERSMVDFLPILPFGIRETVFQDYLIKVFGGVLSFGLLAIALRRRFERKFRH